MKIEAPQHPTFAQVRKGRDGRMHMIESDVLDITKQVEEIGRDRGVKLSVNYNEYGEYYTILETVPVEGGYREKLVTNVNELDQRLLTHLRKISQPGWNAGLEAEKQDKEAKKEAEHKTHEEVGEKAERLAHAVRKDLNPGKIIVPREL